jgi:predicted NUDIX family NTP pyrophosphohydrolase
MIPKGEIEPGEAAAETALREFEEEVGTKLSAVPFPLATIRQAGGKIVDAFAVEGDLDPASLRSNEFEVEWPPRSGKLERYPEVAEARWLSLAEARALMLPSQMRLLDALEAKLRE